MLERTLVRMGTCRFDSRAFEPTCPFHGVLEPGEMLGLIGSFERAPERSNLGTYHLEEKRSCATVFELWKKVV